MTTFYTPRVVLGGQLGMGTDDGGGASMRRHFIRLVALAEKKWMEEESFWISAIMRTTG
jgi:hypothetical protein